MDFTLYLLSSIVVLLIESFFSGSEMALISADRLALRKLAKKGDNRAKTAIEMLKQPERLLGTTNLALP